MFGRTFTFSPGQRRGTAPSPMINLGSGCRTAELLLNTSTIDNANASPPVIIQGIAGYILVPIYAAWHMRKSAGAWSANPGWSIVHDTQIVALTTNNTLGLASGSAGDFTMFAVGSNPAYGVTGFDPVGRSLRVRASIDTNPLGNTASIRVMIGYFLMRPGV